MTRRLGLGVAAIAGLTGALVRGQTTPQVSPPTFRTSTDVVMVDVSVRRGGTPVAGLTAADFQLRDNGIVQQIESVEATAVPIDVTLVVDVSGTPESRVVQAPQSEKIVSQLNADVSRVAAALRPIDRVQVLAVDTYVQQVVPLTPASTVAPIRRLVSGGLASNYDAILAAVLQPVDPARRHVVIASVKVFDTMSAVEAGTVRDVAAQSDALLHIVLMQTASGQAATQESFQCAQTGLCWPVARSWLPFKRKLIDPVAIEAGEDAQGDALKLATLNVPQLWPDGLALQAGADATGGGLHQGRMLSAPTLVGTLAKTFEDFRLSYVLRYAAQGVKREGWHTITVTVPGARGATVHARSGYAIDVPAPDMPAAMPPETPAAAPAASRTPGATAAPLRTLAEFTAAYDGGDYAALSSDLQRSTDPVRLFRDFAAAGNPWPGAPQHEAAFAIELGDAGLSIPRQPVNDEVGRLFERYAGLVRNPIEPDAFERAWLWAAVCATEGRFAQVSVAPIVDRALQRFPTEPRFVLASAIAIDQQWRTFGLVGTGTRLAPAHATEAHVTEVTAKYRAAAAFESTRTEALVRLAWFLHRIGRHDEAIAMLAEAPVAAQDPAVNYLRHLFQGHALMAMDRIDDALAAFRAATLDVPGAQSARVALMTAVAARGDSEAAAVLARQIETTPGIVDPWFNYWFGDYRWYGQAIAAVRAFSRVTR